MTINVLGNYIRDRRQDLGLTQEQLAEQIGGDCRQSDISSIECGHIRLPNLSLMGSLAAALDVSLWDLLVATGCIDHKHVALAPASGDSSTGIPLKDLPTSSLI